MNRGAGPRRSAAPRGTSRPLSGSQGLARGNGPAGGSPRQNGLERAASSAARAQRAPRRWTSAKGDRCAVCGYGAWEVGREGLRLSLHHVFYAQHVEAAGGDVWDPRNALTVCSGPGGCHEGQHDRSAPIPSTGFPDAVFEFGREVFGGPAAFEYLRRRYLIFGDPRLDALLVEV